MPRLRDFNPSALATYKGPRLHPTWNHGWFFESRAWQFVIFLPRWLVKEDEQEEICTARDERLLEGLLQRDFGGCTSNLSSFRGVGYRGPQVETNLHAQIIVIASRWRGTMRYFRALRKELEECSGEERILVLRQEPVIV